MAAAIQISHCSRFIQVRRAMTLSPSSAARRSRSLRWTGQAPSRDRNSHGSWGSQKRRLAGRKHYTLVALTERCDARAEHPLALAPPAGERRRGLARRLVAVRRAAYAALNGQRRRPFALAFRMFTNRACEMIDEPENLFIFARSSARERQRVFPLQGARGAQPGDMMG